MPMPNTPLASNLAGAIGCDFRQSRNQLFFTEYGGKLSRLSLFSPSVLVSQGNSVLKGTYTFDLDNGAQGGVGPGFDIWWEQQTAIERQMTPQNGARIVNLGVTDFNAITADALQKLPYGSTPIPGNNNASNKLVPGDVFAVLTNKGNYAKVKVLSYGYDLHIEWKTYRLEPAYTVLGTGYVEPEDIKLSADGVHAYVTERNGHLLKVALNNANRSAAQVVAAELTAPQQIFLDEVHHAAYVIEYATAGRLTRVDLQNGHKTVLLSNLNHPVGVMLSDDRQYAYISEQNNSPTQGRISRFQLAGGARQTITTNLTAPFFLTWADAAHTTLLVPERDPANRITSVNAATGVKHAIASGVPTRPSSVAMINPGQMLVCSDKVIEEIDFGTAVFEPGGPLLMGIGFIPVDKVVPATGLADTSGDPTYFYQVKNTPFGGTLPLMINHQRAFNDGDAYYRVKVDGIVQLFSWTDEKWNGTHYVAQTTGPTNVAGQAGYYPVHSLAELFLWMNPSLGGLMPTQGFSNGMHTIEVDFVNGAGALLESTAPLHILVDNNHCTALLSPPVLNGNSAEPVCGVLKYAAKNSDQVHMALTASHPHNFATYSFQLIKGVNVVELPAAPPTSGPVASVSSPISDSVASLMGQCNVAGFSEYLYVAATTNNGWGRQSQYDASAALAFVLAP